MNLDPDIEAELRDILEGMSPGARQLVQVVQEPGYHQRMVPVGIGPQDAREAAAFLNCVAYAVEEQDPTGSEIVNRWMARALGTMEPEIEAE